MLRHPLIDYCRRLRFTVSDDSPSTKRLKQTLRDRLLRIRTHDSFTNISHLGSSQYPVPSKIASPLRSHATKILAIGLSRNPGDRKEVARQGKGWKGRGVLLIVANLIVLRQEALSESVSAALCYPYCFRAYPLHICAGFCY
jgi:hypothetical protein